MKAENDKVQEHARNHIIRPEWVPAAYRELETKSITASDEQNPQPVIKQSPPEEAKS